MAYEEMTPNEIRILLVLECTECVLGKMVIDTPVALQKKEVEGV